MYRGIYLIAGRRVEIFSLYEAVHNMCRDYACEGNADFTVTVTPAQIDYERERSDHEAFVEGLTPVHYTDEYLETLAVYRQIADFMLQQGILLFHGSAIAVDGVAYLFTAKSGTGKSTHTRLWRQLFGERAVMINDDKPLLRLTEDEVVVCGTPWNGKHGLGTNTQAPLRAICILERAADNTITPISKREAYAMLLQQTYRPSDPAAMGRVLTLLDQLSVRVGLYRLGCNMDPGAAQVAYEGMARESVEGTNKNH